MKPCKSIDKKYIVINISKVEQKYTINGFQVTNHHGYN